MSDLTQVVPSTIMAQVHQGAMIDIEIQDRKADIEIKRDKWSLCGSQSSGVLIRYVGQLGTCLLVLSFCFVQLIREPEESREVYLSIITGIIGYLMPNPSLPHNPSGV
jgi:hypothetical protein